MLDILVYLFEHFEELGNSEQQTIRLEAEPLSESLIEAGFEREEIDEAFGWLAGLAGDCHRSVAPPSADAVRIYTDREYEHLGTDCLNYLWALEQQNAVPGELRELIIDRAMAMDELTLGHFKIIVLMVLWSRNQAVDSLLVETLLDEDNPVYN
jgi:Smg protein